MPVDQKIVGLRQEPVIVELERGRLRMFAEAVGETNPIYLDPEAARAAGHPDMVASPTILFGLELERADTFEVLEAHGVDLGAVLHGEQSFVYHRPAHAGETLTMRSSFVETYEKAGGALEFIVRRTDVTDAAGELVAELDNVAIVRHTEGSPA
jgi:acyl dehydratase